MSRKKDWFRVTYERDGVRRALFGLGRSTLGGLIVDVGAYKPFPDWGCGIFDLPAGLGSGQVATIDDATKLEPVIAPKLHYHPNGHISINHHGRVERRWIEGKPLSALSGPATHLLTVIVSEPESFPATPPRERDLNLIETARSQALKLPFYMQRLDEVDPRLVAMPDSGIAIPPDRNPFGRVMLLYKFDPYAALIEVVDDPQELSPEEQGIFAVAFDFETMRSGAPTRMLVVQSRQPQG